MSKEITIAQFFQGIELPDGSYLTAGNGADLAYDYTGERLIDRKGEYGYYAPWGGAYICYTCGHLCECGEAGE